MIVEYIFLAFFDFEQIIWDVEIVLCACCNRSFDLLHHDFSIAVANVVVYI